MSQKQTANQAKKDDILETLIINATMGNTEPINKHESTWWLEPIVDILQNEEHRQRIMKKSGKSSFHITDSVLREQRRDGIIYNHWHYHW